VGHLFKDCPLISKERNGNKGQTVPTKNPLATTRHNYSHEVTAHTAHEAAGNSLALETPKKRRKASYYPTSPPLNRSREATKAALSSGMSSSEPCSVQFSHSSYCMDVSMGSQQSSSFLSSRPPPITLACPLQPPPPTFSYTPPSFPEAIPSASSDFGHGTLPHKYQLRSLSRSWAPNSIGIGLVSTPIPLNPPRGQPTSVSKTKQQAG